MTTFELNRNQALLGSAALAAAPALLPPRRARAAEFSAQEAAERIPKDTNGQVQINRYPNNQVGNAAMLSQMRAGALEFFAVSGVNVLSQLLLVAPPRGVGFAWKDAAALPWISIGFL